MGYLSEVSYLRYFASIVTTSVGLSEAQCPSAGTGQPAVTEARCRLVGRSESGGQLRQFLAAGANWEAPDHERISFRSTHPSELG